ncbi:hypothetical protein COCNU_09G006280 [Cocos nucifera]|uniref:Uncharacterized protein n=1 Tax=Cocos nucifera TaxID=13894 RepID=A0A8K0ILP5_COCNU|nr:hypothetical protein COCNU_09G006280 [Cocos nucifera]
MNGNVQNSETLKPIPLNYVVDIRIIQVEAHTADVEMQLYGDGPWSIGNDFELIRTPGHTEVRKDFDFQMQIDVAKDKRID